MLTVSIHGGRSLRLSPGTSSPGASSAASQSTGTQVPRPERYIGSLCLTTTTPPALAHPAGMSSNRQPRPLRYGSQQACGDRLCMDVGTGDVSFPSIPFSNVAQKTARWSSTKYILSWEGTTDSHEGQQPQLWWRLWTPVRLPNRVPPLPVLRCAPGDWIRRE